jgi:hypothetical protein
MNIPADMPADVRAAVKSRPGDLVHIDGHPDR